MATNDSINAKQALSATSSPTFNGLTVTTANITTANISSGTITSAPTIGNDITNKTYVDSISAGLTWIDSCAAATTANLTATYSNGASGVGATLTNSGAMAAFSTDGYSANLNDRILVKDQSNDFENGVYEVTTVGSGAANWVLTRATDYDTAAEIVPGSIIPILNGTLYTNTTWVQTETVTTIGTDAILFSQFSYNIQPLDKGGTSASLTASDGGIFYSTASAGAILSGTATANQMLQSGSSSAPSWSTSTWPATTTINQILFSSAANTVSGIATANNGMLVTSNSGVPSVLAGPGTTGQILQSNAAAAPSFSTASYPSTAGTAGTILRADGSNWVATASTFANTYGASELLYSNGANQVEGLATANNGFLYTNASGVPAIVAPSTATAATDDKIIIQDTDDSDNLKTVTVTSAVSAELANSPTITTPDIVGVTDASNANAGSVGEVISSVVLQTSPTTISGATDITSISLTAGDWDVFGNINATGSTNITALSVWISTTSATAPDYAYITETFDSSGVARLGCAAPYNRINVSSTTTVYITANATGTGTLTGRGGIYARRVR